MNGSAARVSSQKATDPVGNDDQPVLLFISTTPSLYEYEGGGGGGDKEIYINTVLLKSSYMH
jgi:hypothetical protein